MYETILVPTDGSDHAVRAGEHGAVLARAFDATIHLVTVVDIQAAAGGFDAGGVSDEFVERLKAEGEKAIRAIERRIDDRDAVRTATLRGRPSEAILEYADENDVDLLAMGTHGRTGLRRYVAGSVTERVVRLADVPVLTVRATERSVAEDYDEILIPTDGSEPAEVAIEHGIAIAQQFDARVHSVNVVDLGSLTTMPDSPSIDVLDHLESAGETATETVATRAREAGLDAATEVREGYPAKSLLEYAEANDIDLIAMGTAGRTGLSRYLLGSTTERIIRHADVPVLAVNARDGEAG